MKPRIWKERYSNKDCNDNEYPLQWILIWDEYVTYYAKPYRRYAAWDTWDQAMKCLVSIYGYGMVHRDA